MRADRRHPCQLSDFIHRGYQQRLLVSRAGSFSFRLDNDSFLIAPHRFDRSAVELEDFVLISNGMRERGKIPSRVAHNHQAIYRRCPKIISIVHGSPVNATAFSVTGSPCDSRTIPESYIYLREGQKIPFGTQFGDGEELARLVSPQNPVALLENDGALVLGTSILDAFDRLEALESTAEALVNTRTRRSLSSRVVKVAGTFLRFTGAFTANGVWSPMSWAKLFRGENSYENRRGRDQRSRTHSPRGGLDTGHLERQ